MVEQIPDRAEVVSQALSGSGIIGNEGEKYHVTSKDCGLAITTSKGDTSFGNMSLLTPQREQDVPGVPTSQGQHFQSALFSVKDRQVSKEIQGWSVSGRIEPVFELDACWCRHIV